MPEEHGDYTVYVKLNNNAYFDSIQYTDTSGGATYLYERTSSNGGPTTMEPECSIEIGNSFGLRYISLGFQCAGRDNDPTIVVEKKNGETWEPIDESRFLMDIMITFTPYVGDEGDYRISALYYTAEDQDGNPLYYDYAEIPENLIHVTYVY